MVATRIPATAGPTTRAALNIDELRPMALSRSSFPTISTRNACRAGMSNAFTVPSSDASTMMCHTCTRPESVSAASRNARSMDAVCVAMTMRCFEFRSATIPPAVASKKTGNCDANPTTPSNKDEPVIR